ncbi:MAG: LysR family transcriptional regulator [Deltaproteobacteria bacterium]|nr:LysR family transcriptional regulator [Deltaproteobacteria bacterium]
MDINRLRYFCTVVQTENLRRASELLHISPPALSKAMKVFEEEIGIKIIEQIGRGIIVTDQGKRFHEKAYKLLKQIDNLKNVNNDGIEELMIRIGSFEVFTTYFIGPLFSKYFQDFHCELHELIPGKMEDALASNIIDIGITYIPIPHPKIDHLKVGKIKMGLFSAQDKFLNFSFSKLPFVVPIIPVEGSPTKIKGLDGWPDTSLPRFQKYKVTLMESAMELCRQGLAVAYLPKFIVNLQNEKVTSKFALKEIPLHKKGLKEYQYQEVFIIKRKSSPEDANIKKLAKALRIHCCQ